jgi:cell division protein FtsB
MPPARSARAPRRDPAARRSTRGRPRVLAGGAAAIRWDRVSRVALLVVLVVLVYLYAGPARSYWSTWREAKQRSAEVAVLKRENARLRARRAALRGTSALEREARRLGMVRTGERPYVVEHLPKGP